VEWKQLIKTPGNRRRIIVIIALAFFSQVKSFRFYDFLLAHQRYFLVEWKRPGGVLYVIVFIMQAFPGVLTYS